MPDNSPIETALNLHAAGHLADAEAIYRQILQREPRDVEATHLLGMACHQTGRNDEAVWLLRRSVELAPRAAHYRSNLAGVLGKLGIAAEAAQHLREAIRLQPDLAQGHNNLGVALQTLGRLDEAAEAIVSAIRLRPDYPEALNNLGNVLQKLGPVSGAIAAYRRALALRPDYAEAWGNLAAALGESGRTDESLACYAKAVELQPGSPAAHSALLFALHNRHGNDPGLMFERHLEWARRHAEPIHAPAPPLAESPHPDRRLRVGYVSQHFCSHPVARFFQPILLHHDPANFEVLCYSDVTAPDDVTERLRRGAAVWRAVAGTSDDQLAQLVRDDRIDVLVDLDGHMAHAGSAFLGASPPPSR
jgi:protein O-GlcNAc transferase